MPDSADRTPAPRVTRARAVAWLAVAVIAAGLAPPATPAATAQVRRCTTADGGTVFTDRSCKSVDAVDSSQRGGAGAAAAAPVRRSGCARRLRDLISDVGIAIDARDTNGLAARYHWAGMSNRSGYAVIARLDRIAQQPLVNITALRPATPIVAESGPAGASASVIAGSLPPTARSRPPTALRIDQMSADGLTPSRTVFGLRRHMECWWITL